MILGLVGYQLKHLWKDVCHNLFNRKPIVRACTLWRYYPCAWLATLTNNIELETCTASSWTSSGCAGVSTSVTRVNSCSDNRTWSCSLERTVSTGGWPLVAHRTYTTHCCASDNHWTRGCSVLIWTKNESRRRGVGDAYIDKQFWYKNSIRL